jgi:hypothetical protein
MFFLWLWFRLLLLANSDPLSFRVMFRTSTLNALCSCSMAISCASNPIFGFAFQNGMVVNTSEVVQNLSNVHGSAWKTEEVANEFVVEPEHDSSRYCCLVNGPLAWHVSLLVYWTTELRRKPFHAFVSLHTQQTSVLLKWRNWFDNCHCRCKC